MAGYWLVRGKAIKDEDALAEYARRWPPVAARFGAEILAGKGAIETREGEHYQRQLIVRFDSYETAVACYEDSEYQQIMEIARRAYDRELSIIEG